MGRQPHIIIFNPDQWRGDVLGHVGNPAAVTPSLDRLVRTDAVSFSQAFCQNTVCTPSRCSFMTGWYPHVRGHRTMHHMLHPEHGETHLLKVLREQGYFVWWGGKNDLVPGQGGFEDVCDVKFQPSDADYLRWGVTRREGNHGGTLEWRGAPGDDSYFSFFKGRLDTGGEAVYGDGDWGVVLGAVDFIRSYDADQPLCLYLPLSYPHPPYCVEDPFYSIIDRKKVPPRIPVPEDGTDKPALLKGIRDGQGLQKWDEDRWTELRAVYYGMCARADHQFGLVVDALLDAGLYDDSAVFMFSDHGDFTGDYGLVEKTQNTFEDCLSRVPFVIKPPASCAVKPRVSNAMVELVDFAATVFDFAGIDPGYDHFGRSLRAVLGGDIDDAHRDAVFCEGGRRLGEIQAMELESSSAGTGGGGGDGLYHPRICLQTTDEGPPYHTKAAMCRTSEFKYVHRLYEKDEFYDLGRDPGETANRVDDPAYVETVTRLRRRLLDWYMETADVVPRATDKR